MLLGGPVFAPISDPSAWVTALRAEGYRAAFCPVGVEADPATVRAFADAAARAGIVIAEVGAWSNPLSPDRKVRKDAVDKCVRSLELADRIGARCCVNISGSRGEKWDGPSPLDLTDETFDMIVQSVREIIDGAKPTRTFYTLETMPWMYPDSPESYLRVVEAVDRERFAVHLDVVNMISSPQRHYGNAAFVRECFRLLGPRIRSCHAKDTALGDSLTTHLDEVGPGQGGLDYVTFLRELAALGSEVPLMLEHLKEPSEYRAAADYIRRKAREAGLSH